MELNWIHCPWSLTKIYLQHNCITELNWKYVPWNLDFSYNNTLNYEYNEYKKSCNNISVPYILPRHKELMEEFLEVYYLPPPQAGSDDNSSYYEYPLYKHGGLYYKDIIKKY
jgi:hypothetical protein